MPYLTPETAPERLIHKWLSIPQDIMLIGAVTGQLSKLGLAETWEDFGALTPTEVSQIMMTFLGRYIEWRGSLIGSMFPFIGLTPPEGTLPCGSGITYLRVDFPELYEYLIGSPFIVSDDIFSTPLTPDFSLELPYNWCIVSGRTAVDPLPMPETHYLFDADASGYTETSGSEVNLGLRFSVSVECRVVGCRLWVSEFFTGDRSCFLWETDGTPLATADFPAITETGWLEVMFDSPITIPASTDYIMSVYTPAEFLFSFGYFSSAAWVNSPMTAPQDNGTDFNGIYSYGSEGTFPTSRPFGANYWINPIIEVD
jgi:hypothetical protein